MNRDNTALLVIDPVNSCAHEKCETPEWNIHFSKIRKMLPKLNGFISKYREQIGGLIVIATITPWTKKYLPENLKELYTDPKAEYYSEDESGFDERFFAVKPTKTDLVITKNTYDVFTNKELVKELKEKGIRYIAMTGVFTDGCVLSSVINGFSKGYNFVILKDMVETIDGKERQQLQKLLLNFTFPMLYGKTITSKEFIEAFKNQL